MAYIAFATPQVVKQANESDVDETFRANEMLKS